MAKSSKPQSPRGKRKFRIYTADQKTVTVPAASLASALRKCGAAETEILAGVEIECLPSPETESRPFVAVILANHRFKREG